MTNYNDGKIYVIRPTVPHDKSDQYIGSTTQRLLCQRMSIHTSLYRYWLRGERRLVTSFLLFEKYGIENCKIFLLESVIANTKDELFSREGYYIDLLPCINRVHPSRRKEIGKHAYSKLQYQKHRTDILEQKKQHYNANIETMKEKNKIRYQMNREEIITKAKEYHLDHKDTIREYKTEYYQLNKQRINDRNKERVYCDTCACSISRGEISSHNKCKKHLNNLLKFDYEYGYYWNDGTQCTEQEFNNCII